MGIERFTCENGSERGRQLSVDCCPLCFVVSWGKLEPFRRAFENTNRFGVTVAVTEGRGRALRRNWRRSFLVELVLAITSVKTGGAWFVSNHTSAGLVGARGLGRRPAFATTISRGRVSG